MNSKVTFQTHFWILFHWVRANLPHSLQAPLSFEYTTQTNAEFLPFFTHTEILVLSSNQFTGSLPLFPYNSSIRGLYLSDNSLSGELASGVCALSNLQALFLSENQFNGTIPACVGSLMKLQQFYVSQNMLSGEIPPDFSDLVFLSKYAPVTSITSDFPAKQTLTLPCI